MYRSLLAPLSRWEESRYNQHTMIRQPGHPGPPSSPAIPAQRGRETLDYHRQTRKATCAQRTWGKIIPVTSLSTAMTRWRTLPPVSSEAARQT